MRKFLLAVVWLLVAFPAYAAQPERTQETVDLGNNRFLIFVGEPNETRYAYTADLVVLQNNIPHFEPLFAEEYDADNNTANLSEGLAFLAQNYHFDKNTSMLIYTYDDAKKHLRYVFKYLLVVDIFKLQEVVAQSVMNNNATSIPKVLFKTVK